MHAGNEHAVPTLVPTSEFAERGNKRPGARSNSRGRRVLPRDSVTYAA